jgi:hypothetical protein
VELQQLGAGTDEFCRKHNLKGPYIHPDVDRPGTNMSNWLYDRSDDYCSVAFWYQKSMEFPLPTLPDRNARIKGIGMQPWEKEKSGQPAGTRRRFTARLNGGVGLLDSYIQSLYIDVRK